MSFQNHERDSVYRSLRDWHNISLHVLPSSQNNQKVMMLNLNKGNHFTSPKQSLVFFSAGIILILGLFLVGIPMNVLPTVSQESQEQNDEFDHGMSSKDDQNNEQITVEKIISMQIKVKPIKEMSCIELNQFILSFEKGWGAAITTYDERCS